ncbi:VWA-like domain-containing protein [Kineosporia mesophila]|uniref:VWA-like domain-containing protein n=1 Tax=Kineosporia mesophila TaxID=566012 RepID=A0ABP6ZJT6_9ACTN|nr:VWA-like domain-containing protein [Kineosporia mesophila]MCD5349690.1 VWA-like domain-containing protein [Kineosporia mesophila]
MDHQKLLAGRLLAAQAHPYLAGALFALTIVPDRRLFTMAVDRYWRCYVSPSFVEACDVGELAGAWIHEVGHLLREHHARGDDLWERSRAGHGSCDPSVAYARSLAGGSWLDADQPGRERLRMNIAMDCEINDDEQKTPGPGGIRLPAGSLVPIQFGLPEGRPFESYLRELPATVVNGYLAWLDCGSGAHGGDAPWDLGPDDGHPLGAAEAEVIRIRTAEQIKRGRGRTPGRWSRWADEVGRPKQDWHRILGAAVRARLGSGGGSGDHTFNRPGRRSAALGGRVVLPALTRPAPEVAVVIDTSGSVSDDELGCALAETAGIISAAGGRRVTVYSCDSAVQTAQQVASARQITLAGGGGTDLRQGIRRALASRPVPDVMVILTDGHTGWPESAPQVPVVIGVFGPEPELDDDGEWHPKRPPAWARTIRIG